MAYRPPPVNPYGSQGFRPRPRPRPRPPAVDPYGSSQDTSPAGTEDTSAGSATGNGGGGGGRSAYNPYEDPFYRQLAELYRAQDIAETAAAQQRIAALKAHYGAEESLDPLTLFGRLAEAYGLEQKLIPAALAARGLFRSGSTAAQLNRARVAYLQRRYDLSRQLAELIAGIEAGLAAGIFARKQALIQAAWNAAIAYATGSYPGGGGGGGGSGGGTTGGPSGGGGTTASAPTGVYPSYTQPGYVIRPGMIGIA